MRNLHAFIKQEFGEESVLKLQLWEKVEKKMADYKNHRRFTIKCLKRDITPVSIKLRTSLSTKKASQIIRKAERQLLNECIRNINNTIEINMFKRDAYFQQLEKELDQGTLQECLNFIGKVRECRHKRVQDRQIRKFNTLEQKTSGHSKQDVWENREKDGIIQNQERTRKWVINLSKTPLTSDQERLLAHGPKFVITPKETPATEYIAATEQACTKMLQDQNNKRQANMSKEELKALKELKMDNNRLILTADKGVALVVIYKQEYIKKVEDLLQESSYKKITDDPTAKLKNKLISILKKIKADGGLKDDLYRRLYPTGAVSPKFYGLPKIHKPGIPLRPIISSIGTVTYNTAKELARILKPLVGLSKHHIHNTIDFVQQIKEVKLKEDESMVSYDVTALFTSVPIPPVIKIIEEKLKEDKDLSRRTSMNTRHITQLLEFCLRSTSFVFQGQHYEQVEGAAMGSPLSPIVANIYMEHFETRALETAPHPPSIWKRYVDDTFVIQKTTHKGEFFQHLNSIEEKIQFTAENTKADGSLPFLDTLVTVKEDGSLSTSIYRKPTHTNQYLQWDSHHSIANKFSVINSLIHRANNICSNQEQKKEELTQIEKALTTCKYPSWAIQRVKLKKNIQKQTKKTNNINITNRSSITVPYNQGLSESFKNIGKKYGIQVHFKSGRTIKDELVAPKDKDHITKKSGIIYRFKCDRLECDEEYIGETSRTFGERFREHLKAPSPIHDHSNTSGHTTTLDNFKVVGREEQSLSRLIKESMYIRVNGPSLNKNIGKYHLPHMWDEVLNNSRELKLK